MVKLPLLCVAVVINADYLSALLPQIGEQTLYARLANRVCFYMTNVCSGYLNKGSRKLVSI